MKIFYVSKKEWDHHMEYKGVLVIADNQDKAIELALKDISFTEFQSADTVDVREIAFEKGIICDLDYAR